MLEHLFGSKTRLKLLQVFFYSPDKYFYVRELSRLVSIQLNAVRREIANLENLGIIYHVSKEQVKEQIKEREIGTEKSKYYCVRIDSLLYDELKALLSKVKVVEEQEIINEITDKVGDLKIFLLSGVFTSHKDATIDMLLVGKIKPVTMKRLVKKCEGILRQPLRYTIMTEEEYRERKEIGDKFLYNIFEGEHVIVVDKITTSF